GGLPPQPGCGSRGPEGPGRPADRGQRLQRQRAGRRRARPLRVPRQRCGGEPLPAPDRGLLTSLLVTARPRVRPCSYVHVPRALRERQERGTDRATAEVCPPAAVGGGPPCTCSWRARARGWARG